MKEALFLFLPCCFVSEVRTFFLWGCSHLVLGNHCLDIGTKRCCVHTLSTLYCATVYIVTPCQTLYWNMSLAARTKQWTARNLQKLCAQRDPVPIFVPKFYRGYLKKGCVDISAQRVPYLGRQGPSNKCSERCKIDRSSDLLRNTWPAYAFKFDYNKNTLRLFFLIILGNSELETTISPCS